LLVIGDTETSQAFWQVSAKEDVSQVLGFIPLSHRSDVFHNLKSHPLISFEGEKNSTDSLTFTLASNVDRNLLFPQNAELDAVYTQTLQQLFALFKQQKWNSLVWPVTEPSPNQSQADRQKFISNEIWEKARKDHKYKNNYPHTVISELSLFKRGIIEDIALSSVRLSPSGRSHFVQIMHSLELYPIGDTAKIQNSWEDDILKCKEKLDKMLAVMKQLQIMCTKGVALYNPFFAKENNKPPLVLVDSATLYNPVTSSPANASPNSSSKVSRKVTSPSLSLSSLGQSLIDANLPTSSLIKHPHTTSSTNEHVSSSERELSASYGSPSYSKLPPDPSIISSGSPLPPSRKLSPRVLFANSDQENNFQPPYLLDYQTKLIASAVASVLANPKTEFAQNLQW